MPIDMTNVIQIMHGGKEVVKIEDSNGGILWQKQDRPFAEDSINITVGSGYNITTTQYFDRIVIPSRNSISNYIANKQSVEIKSIKSVEIEGKTYLYWCRQGVTSGTYTPFLLNSGSLSATIVATGNSRTIPNNYYMQFSSSNYIVDVISYLSDTLPKAFYGARSANGGSTPYELFSSSTGAGTWHFCTTSQTTLPHLRLRVVYEYYTD